MQTLLDGALCEMQVDSVADAIMAGADAAGRAGRRIIEVHIDGERISDAELSNVHALSRDASEVRLVSADPAMIVRETFLGAGEALSDVETLQRQAAELVQRGDLAGAMPPLSKSLELWMMVQDAAVKGADFAGIDLDSVVLGGEPLFEAVKRLESQLQQLAGALRQRDPVALADALLYEMPQIVAEWKGLLQVLAGQVDEAHA